MRTYKNIDDKNGRDIIKLLNTLSKPDVSVNSYREAFYQIGLDLGQLLNNEICSEYGNVMLACANEDADWLAHGVLDTISADNVSLAVFWNDRIKFDNSSGLEYSPIIQSYVEPMQNCQTLILVKSIISTSCVIRTQLTRLIGSIRPDNIYIAAPVMYKDAEENLRREFPEDISDKFVFLTFAIDDSKDEKNCIVPGIGGLVYSRLGLGSISDKNKYTPEIVKMRFSGSNNKDLKESQFMPTHR